MLPAVYVNHNILKQQGPERPHRGPLRTFADTAVYAFPPCTKPFFNSAFHASKAGLSVILDRNANTH